MLKKVEKSKILLSFVAIALIFVLLGNVYSLATENTNNTVTITATTDTTGGNSNENTNSNTNTNTANITSIVSSNTNTTDNTSNNTANNTSTYNNTNATTNSSSLPYTGTNSKTIVLVVLFAISAVYAYKKVSDYNI